MSHETPGRIRHQRDKLIELRKREPQEGFRGRTYYLKALRASVKRICEAGRYGFAALREQVEEEDKVMKAIDHNNVGDLKPSIAEAILGGDSETGQP